MSQIQDNLEETPFLTDPLTPHISLTNSKRSGRTPLPWRQFSILFLLRVSESITAHAMSPFLPRLIRDIGVTGGKDSRVGYYVGLLQSSFYLTEACTAFHWSRLSDNIGRKPVLLIGLFGLAASMWGFGLSKTFWGLVLSRCLNAALDGSNSVIKSMVIEITDATNIAQAYSILPMTSALGATIGPLIGGRLARPAERFPRTFGNSHFLKEYPYFLPCVISATVTVIVWLVVFMFLRETTSPRMSLRRYLFGGTTKEYILNSDPETYELLCEDSASEAVDIDKQPTLRALLTRPVFIAIGSYATLSLIEMALHSLTPVFYATPIEAGGLDLDSPAIGTILALFGIPGGIVQCIFFAPMHDWLGAKVTFLSTVSLSIPVIGLFPAINAVARIYGLSNFVWFLVGLQRLLLVFVGFAFEIVIMFVGAAAPNKRSIGATNGLAQTIVCLMRVIGPVTVNSAFSLSIEKNIMGGYLPYGMMLVMVGLTLWVGRLLPNNMWDK